MRANAVNLATFANALCHLNTTPLSVVVLAPCAWGESVAWQGVVSLATHNTAWRGEFGNKTKFNDTAKQAQQIRLGKRGENGVCKQNNVWRHCKFSTEKMEQYLGGGLLSLSLSLSLLALFGTPLG